jgi:hydrogenase expression/formation protein HypD
MDRSAIEKLVEELRAVCGGLERVQLMEVCGTHTVSLFRSGVKSLLPANLRLVSGPGCPVCVTSQGYLDAALELAQKPDVTLCTYGDMVRVPGRRGSLADQRARGAKVVVVYSALEAIRLARRRPEEKIVFLAVGFETTAPATAAVLLEARAAGMGNFFVLPGHKLVVPAMMALLGAGDAPIDGFLCPGHVSVIIGADAYKPIVGRFARPCVVAGFEPAHMLQGVLSLCRQVAAGEARVENVYGAAVRPEGNPVALRMIDQVFRPAPAVWRAMGELPDSGLELRDDFRAFDAREAFGVAFGPDEQPSGCRCGEVIQGKADPAECPLFGRLCTPVKPVGPCMVSSEGACAAWYKYGGRANK